MKHATLLLAIYLPLAASSTGAPPAGQAPAKPQPTQTPPAESLATTATPKESYTVFHVPINAIALTFDDGPHPKNTPRLLDILKEKNVKATFFLIGKNVTSYPAIVKRIVAEGHEVGNDTWIHRSFKKLPDAQMLDDLQKDHDAIVAACGVAPTIYRPPFGTVTAKQQKAIMERFHYPAIIWEVDTRDWQAPRTAAKVHDIVMKETHGGSIILCHDIHETTVDAMPATLDELKAKGFQFLTVSEMIQLDPEKKKDAAPPAAAPNPAPSKAPTPPKP